MIWVAAESKGQQFKRQLSKEIGENNYVAENRACPNPKWTK